MPPRPPPACALAARDSLWLHSALDAWEYTRGRILLLPPRDLPALILFDTRCVHEVTVGAAWSVTTRAHGGNVPLPNGRAIRPLGVGVTSPTVRDSSVFVALALPDVWRADPRYAALNESRPGWERYLTGAFIHEMTHARMLPAYLPRLRMLEAAIYPDTIDDNAIQTRFARNVDFAAGVARETDLLYRAAGAPPRGGGGARYARAALTLLEERRTRFYVDDLAPWAELEQLLLDLEGIAQWAAFTHARHTTDRVNPERALARFRSGREFWSEDQGLALILVVNSLVPGWQARAFSDTAESSLALLTSALAARR